MPGSSFFNLELDVNLSALKIIYVWHTQCTFGIVYGNITKVAMLFSVGDIEKETFTNALEGSQQFDGRILPTKAKMFGLITEAYLIAVYFSEEFIKVP